MQHLCERIKLIRKNAKLTQVQFGEKLAISGSYVSRLESGKEEPTEMLLKLIALTFNISTDWLINGKGTIQVSRGETDYFERAYNKEHTKKLEEILDELNTFVNNNPQYPIALNLSAVLSSFTDILKISSINPAVGMLIFERITNINLELCYQLEFILKEDVNSINFDVVTYKHLLLLSQTINEELKTLSDILYDYGKLIIDE